MLINNRIESISIDLADHRVRTKPEIENYDLIYEFSSIAELKKYLEDIIIEDGLIITNDTKIHFVQAEPDSGYRILVKWVQEYYLNEYGENI